MENKTYKTRRIDVYLSIVIISSIILSGMALWALAWQYRFVNYQLKDNGLASTQGQWLGIFSKISLFALSMIIFSLVIILILGSYLSNHDMQRQIELARLRNDFVSTVSHELKTPLTSIRLLTERLINLKPEEAQKQKEYYKLILAQSYQLSYLINNILDFSKLEKEGKKVYDFVDSDLSTIIGKTLEDYPVNLIRPDCKLETHLAKYLPAVHVDVTAICQAFTNLLNNALKFSPPEGIVTIRTGKTSKKEIFLEVRDQGPGIEEDEKNKVFEKFYHGGKGTGLGLALVASITKAHDGRVELESKKGAGSTFRIILPIKETAKK